MEGSGVVRNVCSHTQGDMKVTGREGKFLNLDRSRGK